MWSKIDKVTTDIRKDLFTTIFRGRMRWLRRSGAVVELVETTGHFDKLNDRIETGSMTELSRLNDLKAKFEQTAQAILDARQKYSDCSFAQLYGSNDYLFTDLVAAHKANDRAVMKAYGFTEGMSDEAIVGELFKMYEKLTAKQPEAKSKGRKKTK